MRADALATATLGLLALTATTLLLGWGYFRRYRVSRPPIGVMTLGDLLVLIAGIILIPLLYLALPGWLVVAIIALGAFGILQMLLEPALPGRWSSWVVAGGLVGSDILIATQGEPGNPAQLVINDLMLILLVVGVTNLWAQSGLKARDLAILASVLALYDLIATALLPLTSALMTRLADLPLSPVLIWPAGNGAWVGLGLGDLLLATVGPLVFLKAFGKSAGLVALAISITAIGLILAVPLIGWPRGVFPVMVVLGPLLVAQYGIWLRRSGVERTTAAYRAARPVGMEHHRGSALLARPPTPVPPRSSNPSP